MRHCRCWYIVSFWGPNFSSDLISPIANIRILSLAMVITFNTRVTKKVSGVAGI